MGLRPNELSALHEILQWGREGSNNPVLKFFGQTFEDFSDACRALFSQFKHVLPKGSNRVRVRVTGKDKLQAKESDLGSTLGDESSGLVVVDYEGHPVRYNQLEVYEQIVARHKSLRFDVQAVGDGFTWRRTSSSLEIDEDTLEGHRESISSGARALREDAFVKASARCVCFCVYVSLHSVVHMQAISVSDPHLDAKIFPIAHPYGTGSLNCESSSVQPQHFCRNRLLALQSFFRRSSRYAFWMLDMQIKRQLFFKNLYRGHRCPRNAAAAADDRFAQTFGTVVPHSIVESTSWWKRQSFELAAICDDAESGRPSTYSRPLLSMYFVEMSPSQFMHTHARVPAMCNVLRSRALRHYAIDGDSTQQSAPVGFAITRVPSAVRTAHCMRPLGHAQQQVRRNVGRGEARAVCTADRGRTNRVSTHARP